MLVPEGVKMRNEKGGQIKFFLKKQGSYKEMSNNMTAVNF